MIFQCFGIINPFSLQQPIRYDIASPPNDSASDDSAQYGTNWSTKSSAYNYTGIWIQAIRIHPVYRIIEDIRIQIRIPAVETDGILGSPSSCFRIIIAIAESDQARICIIEPASEAEHAEAGLGVFDDVAEAVVRDALEDITVGVSEGEEAAEVVVVETLELLPKVSVLRTVSSPITGIPCNRR